MNRRVTFPNDPDLFLNAIDDSHLISFLKILHPKLSKIKALKTADKSILRDEFIRGSTLLKGSMPFPHTLNVRLRVCLPSCPPTLTVSRQTCSRMHFLFLQVRAAYSSSGRPSLTPSKKYSFRSSHFILSNIQNMQKSFICQPDFLHPLHPSHFPAICSAVRSKGLVSRQTA